MTADGSVAVDGADLVVSLGGDGTLLRAVDAALPAGVPVLGVNIGTLGYLTQVEPDDLEDALAHFLAGTHQVEERMTLDGHRDRPRRRDAGPTAAPSTRPRSRRPSPATPCGSPPPSTADPS